MVGMGTRASQVVGIGGRGKHKLYGVTVLRKFSMNVDRSYTGAAGTISKIKTNARLIDDKAGGTDNLFVVSFRRGWIPVYSEYGV